MPLDRIGRSLSPIVREVLQPWTIVGLWEHRLTEYNKVPWSWSIEVTFLSRLSVKTYGPRSEIEQLIFGSVRQFPLERSTSNRWNFIWRGTGSSLKRSSASDPGFNCSCCSTKSFSLLLSSWPESGPGKRSYSLKIPHQFCCWQWMEIHRERPRRQSTVQCPPQRWQWYMLSFRYTPLCADDPILGLIGQKIRPSREFWEKWDNLIYILRVEIDEWVKRNRFGFLVTVPQSGTINQ